MQKRQEISIINHIDQMARNNLLIQVGSPVRDRVVNKLRDKLLNEILDQLYIHTAYYISEMVPK